MAQGHPALTAEIQSKPDDLLLRVRYARSWLVLGNPLESWKQLRKALKGAPEKSVAKREAIRGIEDTLDAMTKLGIFQVGVPNETVLSLIGEPDEKTGNAENRWVYPSINIDFADDRITKITRTRVPDAERVSPEKQDVSGASAAKVDTTNETDPLAKFDVMIQSVGTSKIAAIKKLRKLDPMSLSDAMKLTRDLPKTYKSGLSKEEAEKARILLEETGMEASIEPASEKK